MHPVVVCSALQSFARAKWSVEIFLLLPIEVKSLAGLLDLQSLTFAVFLCHLLFVVGELGLLYQYMFSVLDRTQYAFVARGYLRVPVV